MPVGVWRGSFAAAVRGSFDVRRGDDDLRVYQLLVKFRVLAFLVRSSHQLVALLLNPFPDAQLVLGGSKKLGLLLGVDATLPAVLVVQHARVDIVGLTS